MTELTGHDRYAGTRPERQSQQQSQSQTQAQRGETPDSDEDQSGNPRPVYDQYELNTPETMHTDPEDEATKRAQAAQQSDARLEKGLGYGAQDGEEMAEAPNAAERGYGSASEEREKQAED